jgi:hypothetical protein
MTTYSSYTLNVRQAIGAIVLIGVIYHVLLLMLLRVTDTAARKEVAICLALGI